MEKQMTLNGNYGARRRRAGLVKKAAAWLGAPQRWLRMYYSYVLGAEVSRARARAMTEAQAAFFATVMPVDCPLTIRAIACTWLVVTLKRLRDKSY